MWSDEARQASIEARRAGVSGGVKGRPAAHQTGVLAAVHRDRFTRLVPPGSDREYFVKQATKVARKGLLGTMAYAGGPPAIAAGIMVHYAGRVMPRVKRRLALGVRKD